MQTEIQLTDGSILLRPYRSSDAKAVHKAVRESLPELSVWLPWAHPDYSIEESRTWIALCAEMWAKGTEFNFAILGKQNGAFLGGCGLNQVDLANHFANLGYWVRSRYTRRGVATAAAQLVARFGFKELKLKRIELGAATDNLASQRVAEKLGATRLGIQIAQMVFRDKVYDRVIFSLNRKDFKKGTTFNSLAEPV